jgi:exonuclease SbcC
MSPIKLTLKGFTGFSSALGKNEVSIDLSGLSQEAKLVSIVGPNGAGKTTLIDNLQPYRLLPSRAGTMSPKGFSFWDHLAGAEAAKELVWTHEGRVYRSAFAFKMSGKTKRAEYFLFDETDGHSRPYTTASGIVADGKADTYDACIEAILGDPETYFVSHFSAQNKRPLSALTAGQVKQLLTGLLGLEKIQALAQKAATVVGLLKPELRAAQESVEGVRRLRAEEEAVSRTVAAHEADVSVAEGSLPALESALNAAKASLVIIEADRQKGEAVIAQRATLQANLKTLGETLQGRLAALATEVRSAVSALQTAITGRAQEKAKLVAQRADLDKRLREAQTLIGKKESVDQAKATMPRLEAELRSAEDVLEKANAAWKKAVEAVSAKNYYASRLDNLHRQGASKADELARLQETAKLAEEVPCAGSDLQQLCPLLQKALKANAESVTVKVSLETLREDYRKLKKESPNVDVDAQKTAENAVSAAKQHVQSAKSRLDAAAVLANLAGGIESALASIETIKAAIERIDARLEEIAEEDRAAAAAIETAEQDRAKRAVEIESESTQQKTMIEASLAALPVVPGDEDIAGVKAEVEVAVKAMEARKAEAAKARASADGAKGRLAEIRRQIEAAGDVSMRLSSVEMEIESFQLLSMALGKDGVIALSIDESGPALSKIANDLLLACYGSRFTVEIVTQAEKASGGMSETLEIVVHDSDRGESKPLHVMSGGERVWINEAMSKAIALYLAQVNGMRFGTIFSDEADGPLDDDRKRQFMQMKREVLAIGGYEREFFITQTPELVAMADHVIDVTAL